MKTELYINGGLKLKYLKFLNIKKICTQSIDDNHYDLALCCVFEICVNFESKCLELRFVLSFEYVSEAYNLSLTKTLAAFRVWLSWVALM